MEANIKCFIENLLAWCWSFLANVLYSCSYKLYLLWLWIYNEPDRADVIIFNELQRNGKVDHTEPNCLRKYCEQCRLNRIVKYIDKAKHSIDVAQLAISHLMLYRALEAAWRRGVQVRVVTDSQMYHVRGSTIYCLWNVGIPVRLETSDLVMHHKFAIIDGESRILQLDADQKRWHCGLWSRKGYVMTGSLNWTKQGTYKNFENVVLTSNRKIQQLYQPVFDEMWSSFEPIENTDFYTEGVLATVSYLIREKGMN